MTEAPDVTGFQPAELAGRLRRRHAAGSVARIEVPPDDLGRLLGRREEITGLVRAAGFVFATADLAGLRSGSMNALLPLSVAHRAV